MTGVVRRRLFWRIYLTLLASLVATAIFMGAFFWFLGEAREGFVQPPEGAHGPHGPANLSLYATDGALIGARGATIPPGARGPGHIVRIDLPNGTFLVARFGRPASALAQRILFMILIVAGGVGLAAYPVTALLTRRLEALRAGVTRWGDGATPIRLDDRGSDEVALLARTFNSAAARLDALLASQKALLANASHELRSPLARLRLAIDVGRPDSGDTTQVEIVRNLAEMDQLVDELLLSSRLDHQGLVQDRWEPVDLLGLAAEEGARVDALVTGTPIEIAGDAILLRRLIRNLLENGIKHGKPPVAIIVSPLGRGAEIMVADGGTGIAAGDRDRIFEPFYRPAGSGEASGGWGLGLALVRQIALRHGGSVICRETSSGGSLFVVRLGAT